MAAPLYDLAVLQHHDRVGVAHRGQAVGNDKDGTPLHELVHPLLDKGLGTGVDGGGSLVENQDRRIGHGGPGDGQKLPLALGQIGAMRAARSISF